MLILGNSILEGVGTALLIPPVYILTTLLFTERHLARPGLRRDQRDGRHRRRRRTADRRPHHLGAQLAVGLRLPGARHRGDRLAEPRRARPAAAGPEQALRHRGAPCSRPSASILVVTGILAADNNLWLMLGLLVAGALVLVLFFRSVRAKERAGEEPLLSTELFRNRTSNLGLVTQNAQWLVLMGVVLRGRGLPAGRPRLRRDPDRRHLHRRHGRAAGHPRSAPSASPSGGPSARSSWPASSSPIVGIAALLALVAGSPSVWAFAPGLLLIGLGLGLMLTPSVNVVQSSFGEDLQGEISGLSRSVSNLGSSLGTAIAGTILVAGITVTPGARLRPRDGRAGRRGGRRPGGRRTPAAHVHRDRGHVVRGPWLRRITRSERCRGGWRRP